jgi:RNA polymerase sigma-70 factor (ECF subfamily)
MKRVMAAGDVQAALTSLEHGDKRALDAMIPALYTELRRLAASYLAREAPDHTLEPTALVHEAYLRLVGQRQVDWSSRAQIVGLAATMMRRILVNHAAARSAQKRDWGARVPLTDTLQITHNGQLDVEQLDRALTRLEEFDPRQARVVELRFFSGLTLEETASVLNTSSATVKREWKMARMWLLRQMEGNAA